MIEKEDEWLDGFDRNDFENGQNSEIQWRKSIR
jgi:hypothetical protein